MYVIDTHALVWYLTDDNRLGVKAREILTKIDNGESTGVIPSIVILEAMAIFEKRGLHNLFAEIYAEIKESSNYLIYPLSSEIIDEIINLPLELELHDRIILATAKYLGTPLITKDRALRKYHESIIW